MEYREAILDFVRKNKKPLARYIRGKLVEAGAKGYLDNLGKSGIEAMEREAAGMLLDLACVLVNRLQDHTQFRSEELFLSMSVHERNQIELVRSDGFKEIMKGLIEKFEKNTSNGTN